MKIEFGTVTLGDDSTGDYISEGWVPTQTRLVQVEPLFGATEVFRASRLNKTTTASFTVTKVHADRATALAYAVEHPDDVPVQGTLKLTQGSAVREYADALIPSVECVQINGATTVFRYSVIAGASTEVP